MPRPSAVPPGSRVSSGVRAERRREARRLGALPAALDPLERDERHGARILVRPGALTGPGGFAYGACPWNRSRGRTCLVTGGSRGIGRAVRARLRGGWGRGSRSTTRATRDAAEATATERARAAEPRSCTLAADLDAARGRRARWWTRRPLGLGGLDVLVVNHGIWKHAPLADMTDAQWDETLAVNLDGACGRLPARGPASWSRAGAARSSPSPPPPASAARPSTRTTRRARAALIALTKSLAAELAPHGIRVNGVAPGWVADRHDARGPGRTRGRPVGRAHPARPPGHAGGDRRGRRLPGLRPRVLPVRRGAVRQRRRRDVRLGAEPSRRRAADRRCRRAA